MLDVECADIIAGRATPPGKGAIAVIRMSGKGAFEIISSHIVSKIPVSRMRYFHLYRAMFFDRVGGNPLDDLMIALMPEGKSYTCEDMVEIFSHGGMGVAHGILRSLLNGGARLAEPGEFTYRAFRNGRIDLVQAEGIGILAEARSSTSIKAATSIVTGKVSKRIIAWYEELTRILADLEFGIDFGDDHNGDGFVKVQNDSIEKIMMEMSGFTGGVSAGRLITDGPKVVVAGCSNSGKTTLVNKIAGRNVALADEMPGTTRDSVEVYLNLSGGDFVLIDTAGFGYTEDPLWKQTRKLAEKSVEDADIVIHLVDANKGFCGDDAKIERLAGKKNIIRVWNKIDLISEEKIPLEEDDLCISALTGEKIAELVTEIDTRLRKSNFDPDEEILLLTYRQSTHVKDAENSLLRAKEAIQGGYTEEIIAQEIRDALESLGKLTGRAVDEEVLESIFSRFCIGK